MGEDLTGEAEAGRGHRSGQGIIFTNIYKIYRGPASFLSPGSERVMTIKTKTVRYAYFSVEKAIRVGKALPDSILADGNLR